MGNLNCKVDMWKAHIKASSEEGTTYDLHINVYCKNYGEVVSVLEISEFQKPNPYVLVWTDRFEELEGVKNEELLVKVFRASNKLSSILQKELDEILKSGKKLSNELIEKLFEEHLNEFLEFIQKDLNTP